MAEIVQDEVSISIKSSADDAAKAVRSLSNELKVMGTALKAVSVVGFVKSLKSIGQSIFGYVSKMSDYIETMNQFRTVMGQSTEAANEFINKADRVLSLDPSKLQNALATFQSLGESFGISNDRAYIMGKNLTQLAADMSSFKNISFDQALQKIKSGFVGEIEPMRAVGVALDKVTLQELAYKLGIDQRIDTMTRAQKTELLYYQMLASTSQMQGDLARTLISPANAIRQIQTEFTKLGRAIGSIFIPMLMKTIPYIRAITELAIEAAQAIAAMFGFKLGDYESDISNISSGIGGVSTGIEDIGDSARGTTKELKKMLMPFDELNNVNFNTGSGSGGVGSVGGAGGSLGLDLPEYDMFANASDEMRKKIDNIKQSIKDLLPVIKTVAIALATLWVIKKVADFIVWIAKVVSAFKTLKSWIMGSKLGSLITTIGTGLKNMFWNTNLGTSIKNFKNGTSGIGNVLLNLAALIGGITLSIKGFSDINEVMAESWRTGTIDGWKYAGALTEVAAGFGLVGFAIGGLQGGLIGLGIGLIVGIVDSLAQAKYEANDFAKEAQKLNEVVTEQKQKVDADAESWQKLAKSTEENVTKQLSQATYIEGLVNELDDLADASGNVKDADKARVDFILNEVNQAYGTQYKLSENQITQNGKEVKSLDELKNSIQKVIDKKKAEAIINATADKYAEAILKKSQYYDEMQTALKNQTEAAEKLRETFKRYGITLDEVSESSINNTLENLTDLDAQLGLMEDGVEDLTEAYVNSSDSLEKSSKAWEDASNSIIDIEALRTATLEEDYEAMEKSIENLTETYEINGERQKQTIDKKLSEQLDTYDKYYGKMTETQRKTLDGQLQKTINTLIAQTNNVTTLTPETVEAWRKLAENSKDIYNENIDKVSEGTRLAIQTSIGELDLQTPGAIAKWKKLAETSEEEYNRALGLLPEDTRIRIQQATGKVYDQSWTLQQAGNYAGSTMASNTNSSFNNNLALNIYPSAIKLQNMWGFNAIGKGIANLIQNGIGNINVSAGSIQGYATGGFPETGQLFMANEAGPELVGNIGRRTAVANKGQITEGIAVATYNAISRALAENRSDSNINPHIIVNVGNERLYSGYGRYQDEQSNMYGVTI